MENLTDMPSGVLLSILGIGLSFLLIIFYLVVRLQKSEKAKNESEDKFQQLEGKINKLELQTLESKLNPHLFKNILNSIQSHAYQTYFALDKLANVLDYILYESRNKFVTPKEEIDFALNLIEINKIKVSPLFELKVKTKVNDFEPLFEQRVLAPLISIDLIENAFKHADLQRSDAFIAVTFEFKENIFSLTVANKVSTKKPMKKEKGGFGVESLEQRLKIIYSDNFKLDRFLEGDVYIAHLKINLIEHKAKMLAARR
ncbi:sensor histidine kinase [Algoriphagus sp.]|jgi:LytS/YehU family sensor histidine kinase|uniref:sensor histidine kinase n=1 Tax=Algoriphagus sp. TaxID=1872435 RepID=UPI002716D853|nr:histidine kinase [Algoriphagus sp.]MDO8965555.1 histidine kinase [Algoriphagus sp.]MDP3201595.1 histidine kinase [Algoriphagus sp.]